MTVELLGLWRQTERLELPVQDRQHQARVPRVVAWAVSCSVASSCYALSIHDRDGFLVHDQRVLAPRFGQIPAVFAWASRLQKGSYFPRGVVQLRCSQLRKPMRLAIFLLSNVRTWFSPNAALKRRRASDLGRQKITCFCFESYSPSLVVGEMND